MGFLGFLFNPFIVGYYLGIGGLEEPNSQGLSSHYLGGKVKFPSHFWVRKGIREATGHTELGGDYLGRIRNLFRLQQFRRGRKRV